MNVLISLHRGYGLGDAAQMSAVLRHVAKYRSHWIIDYQAEIGKHIVGRGIVASTFAYGQPYPYHYDAEVQICLYDTFANWEDRPNTRVSNCLHETFGLPWDAECGRYQVQVSDGAESAARALLSPVCGYVEKGDAKRRRLFTRGREAQNLVAVHYMGDSSSQRKDLTHTQASAICKAIEKLGYTPILLDWRNKSPIPDSEHVFTVGRFPTAKEWGGDAEMNCAVIHQCAAFVGIDSGPGKCAAATDTPSLIIWTGHHPSTFHDPAPNTTHLVPADPALVSISGGLIPHRGLEPQVSDGAWGWFEKNYKLRYYSTMSSGLLSQVEGWLQEKLT